MLKWLSICLVVLALNWGVLAQKATAEGEPWMDKPWEEWTEEELLAQGWIPYNCFGTGPEGRDKDPMGKRWPRNDPNGSNEGACICYSYMLAGGELIDETPYSGGISFNTFPWTMVPLGAIPEIEAAIDTWEGTADVHLDEVPDCALAFDHPAADMGRIRIGAHEMDGSYGELAHAYFPPPTGITAAGDLHFDEHEPWVTEGASVDSPYVDFDIQTVALHELGHSLGLAHAGTKPGDIMFGAYRGPRRAPSGDDAADLVSIYGPPGHPPECGEGPSAIGPSTWGTVKALYR